MTYVGAYDFGCAEEFHVLWSEEAESNAIPPGNREFGWTKFSRLIIVKSCFSKFLREAFIRVLVIEYAIEFFETDNAGNASKILFFFFSDKKIVKFSFKSVEPQIGRIFLLSDDLKYPWTTLCSF